MLKSLYSGVSGLRNHQTKLDVLGNNISNVNTVGFKASRVVFSQALTQAFANSTNNSGTGFINPIQIGLGVQVNSIDRMFNQGSFESTGNMTDLAIAGDGFFVLRNGDNEVYSRTGNFFLDQSGRLVNPKGLSVQGYMLGNTPVGGNGIEDIRIDSSILSNAIATTRLTLAGNLDAGLAPRAQVWSTVTSLTTKALLQGNAVVVPLTVAAGTNDEFELTLSGTGNTVNEVVTLTAGVYATVDDLITELNAQIAANAQLTGKIEAINSGGQVKFRSQDNISTSRITVNSGTNDVLADLGFINGDSAVAGQPATAATELNDLLQTTTDLVTGDVINILGDDVDGSDVAGIFTYGTDGTTIQDFLTVISANYSGATATMEDGLMVLTDDIPGSTSTTIRFSADSGNAGSIGLPDFTSTTDGFTGSTSASILIYDSLGGSHNLLIEYTKTPNPGEWSWEVQTGGDEVILGGGTGTVQFGVTGELLAFEYDNNATELAIDPGNDAAVLSITIQGDGGEDYVGLSQFDAASTFFVSDQDGRAVGQLQSLAITDEGILAGAFTNGEVINLAQIALARFKNNGGLIDLGDGLNEVSISSGQAEIFAVGDGNGASIAAGTLEMSNVDLSREFTELIVAQRGFQANAKVITTADQILDELIRIKR